MSNLKSTYFNLDSFVLKKLLKEQEEIEPIGGETKSPNEFAYFDFKSWAYEVGRKELFREKKFKVGDIEYTLEEATEMGAGIMFSVLTQIWTLWTEETDNDQFGRIKDNNVNDFGKALYNMMKKDNFFFSKEERGAKVGMDQQDADYLKQTYGVEMNEKKIGFKRGPEYSEETEDLLNDFAKSTEIISKELKKKIVDSDDPKVQEILNLLDNNLDPEFIDDLDKIYNLIQELPDKPTERSKVGFRQNLNELNDQEIEFWALHGDIASKLTKAFTNGGEQAVDQEYVDLKEYFEDIEGLPKQGGGKHNDTRRAALEFFYGEYYADGGKYTKCNIN